MSEVVGVAGGARDARDARIIREVTAGGGVLVVVDDAGLHVVALRASEEGEVGHVLGADQASDVGQTPVGVIAHALTVLRLDGLHEEALIAGVHGGGRQREAARDAGGAQDGEGVRRVILLGTGGETDDHRVGRARGEVPGRLVGVGGHASGRGLGRGDLHIVHEEGEGSLVDRGAAVSHSHHDRSGRDVAAAGTTERVDEGHGRRGGAAGGTERLHGIRRSVIDEEASRGVRGHALSGPLEVGPAAALEPHGAERIGTGHRDEHRRIDVAGALAEVGLADNQRVEHFLVVATHGGAEAVIAVEGQRVNAGRRELQEGGDFCSDVVGVEVAVGLELRGAGNTRDRVVGDLALNRRSGGGEGAVLTRGRIRTGSRLAVVDDTGLGVHAASETSQVGHIVTTETEELLLSTGDGVGLITTGGLMGAHVETLLRGVDAADSEARRDGHVGTHDELAGGGHGAAQRVLDADFDLVGRARGQGSGGVTEGNGGGDAILGDRHPRGDVGAIELDGQARGDSDRRSGVHRGDGEADRAAHRATDDDVIGRDGLQADVVNMVHFPSATSAAAENEATRGRSEGARQTAGRGQLDTLPENLDLAFFGQHGLELLPLQVLHPQGPLRIVEADLSHTGVIASRAVIVEVVGGVQGTGLHRGRVVRVGRRQVAEGNFIEGAAGPDIAGAQGHRELGEQLTFDADANAYDVGDAARMVTGLPGVETDAQTGQGTFFGEVGLTGGARVRGTIGGQRIVGADVVEREAVRGSGRATTDAEVALEGEGLDDETLVEVVEHHGGALAALGVGDGEVTIGGAAGGTAAGTIFCSGCAHFFEGQLRCSVEVNHVGGGISRAADQPGCRHPTQQVCLFMTHIGLVFSRRHHSPSKCSETFAGSRHGPTTKRYRIWVTPDRYTSVQISATAFLPWHRREGLLPRSLPTAPRS